MTIAATPEAGNTPHDSVVTVEPGGILSLRLTTWPPGDHGVTLVFRSVNNVPDFRLHQGVFQVLDSYVYPPPDPRPTDAFWANLKTHDKVGSQFNEVEYLGKGGTVTLTEATSSRISGSFSITMQRISTQTAVTVTGTFSGTCNCP